MQALPSIAFGGFSGSAKGVTARQVAGRTILSVRTWPTGASTNAQVARRASMSKITKSWKLLSNEQMKEWDRLAEHSVGQSVFGQKAEISGMNLYIRLNVNRAMAGESLLADAPDSTVSVPNAAFSKAFVTPNLVVLMGIEHKPSPNKLVIKMSGCQSPGVSNGWSKTVILSSDQEDDWGEADVTTLYLNTIGVVPVVGQKVFIEVYWMNTETGFTGEKQKVSVIVLTLSEAKRQGYTPRKRVNMNNIDKENSEAEEFDLDFSTSAPVLNHSGVLISPENYAASKIVPLEKIEGITYATSYCLNRGVTDEDRMFCGSAICYISSSNARLDITYGHRGGVYSRPTEVFGPGILFDD